jgi:uncharacterized protein with von Willebrand factor type A (vWA) domain
VSGPPVVADGGERVLRRVAGFGRVLRARGLEVGPRRLQDALAALGAVDVTSREESYWALRCTLVSHHEDIEVFDAAFAAFWEKAGAGEDGALEAPAPRPPDPEAPTAPGDAPARAGVRREAVHAAEPGGDEDGPEDGDTAEGMAWSAVERLRELDFAEYTDDELREARRLLARVARAVPLRRSRRLEAAPSGPMLDKRRTMRSAMRTEGTPVLRLARRRRLVPRKVVFVVDVSGSMGPYARAMVMFLQAAVAGGRRVEAFTFGTRLTRVTRHLDSRDPDRALRAAAQAVPDWAGGTRIGDNIKALNDRWGRRGLTRGAVVVIVSDGWERGDVDLLGREMRALRRTAHTILWVNPLAGEPGYQPLAQGMAAALPHLDLLLEGHNLHSLEALARVLEALPSERGRRAGRAVVRG